MPRLLVLTALAAGALVTLSVASGQPEQKAELRLLQTKPLALRGTGFRPGESVRVTLLASIKRTSRRATAGPNGSFKVSFPRGAAEGCSLQIAHAVGSEGSRASVRVGRAPCPPPR
jgi:hypothetical protein